MSVDVDEAGRRLEKPGKKSDARLLDPWERYRALVDLLDAQVDLAEMADRKTRFALIILGALNAANLLVAVRPNLLAGAHSQTRLWLGAYIGAYAVLSLFAFVQAIAALKPRVSSILGRIQAVSSESTGLPGLRFIGNMLEKSAAEYYEGWTRAQVGQVSREIALNAQLLARVNTAKYRLLGRLYTSLLILVFLTAGLVTLLAYSGLMRTP